MKRPPIIELVDDESNTCKRIPDHCWSVFLKWLAEELPLFVASVDGLDGGEHKSRMLVMKLAREVYDLDRNLTTERATVTAMTGERPGELIDKVVAEDFHMLANLKAADGSRFEFGLVKPLGNIPALHSRQTGKVFVLDLKAFALLAMQKGIEAERPRIIVPRA